MDTETGQTVSIVLIRLAGACWLMFALTARARHRNWQLLRWSWLAATSLLVLHVVTAIGWFHDWSHRLAAEHTARRTHELTGISSSSGIWWNYLFVAVCVHDAIDWFRRPQLLEQRSRRVNQFVYGFAVFMIFNAAVVFVSNPWRWVNLAGLVLVAVCWPRRLEYRSTNSAD